MDRISSYASHQRMLSTVFAQQARRDDAQWQVGSGKRYQSYQGFGIDSGRLLSLEATRIRLDRFAQLNDAVRQRLDIAEPALRGIDATLRGFREALMTTGGNDPLDPEHVKDLQQAAFRAMQEMEALLNTPADGRFLFAGSRVKTKPVDLGLSTLEAFQARYDGLKTLYPPTREAHLGASLKVTTAESGGLVVSGGNTIATVDQSRVPSPFAQIAIGATITLEGSGLGNTGTFTVVAKPSPYELVVSGTLALGDAALTVDATLTDGAEAPGAILSLGRWYQGDEVTATHRVEDQRQLTFDLTAVDPAFEKALRAMGMIAQGAPGSEGGLAARSERIAWAIDLLNHAIERAPAQPPPFGPEAAGSIADVRHKLGFHQALLHETAKAQGEFLAKLEIEIAKSEDIDVNEASARLLEANAALEAAYAAIALVRQLSLVKFL